jgi:ornithine carbamoyltransferase
MVARVGPHSDVTGLADHSSVPVINALSDDFHPLQIIADFTTIHEAFPERVASNSSLGLEGMKAAWIGDSNNVLFDYATACIKMGVDIAVASPTGYGIPDAMRQHILSAAAGVSTPGKLIETTVPEEAIKDADILVTDTWVSMGQEAETQKRLKAFAGYQITNDLAKRGGAKADWKFMHCLPRHPEEVADEVFYSDRSLVFPEAENRLWAAVGELPHLLPLTYTDKKNLGSLTILYSCSRRLCGQQGKAAMRYKHAGHSYGDGHAYGQIMNTERWAREWKSLRR